MVERQVPDLDNWAIRISLRWLPWRSPGNFQIEPAIWLLTGYRREIDRRATAILSPQDRCVSFATGLNYEANPAMSAMPPNAEVIHHQEAGFLVSRGIPQTTPERPILPRATWVAENPQIAFLDSTCRRQMSQARLRVSLKRQPVEGSHIVGPGHPPAILPSQMEQGARREWRALLGGATCQHHFGPRTSNFVLRYWTAHAPKYEPTTKLPRS